MYLIQFLTNSLDSGIQMKSVCYLEQFSWEMSALISSKIAVLACMYTFSFAFAFWGGVTLQLSTFNLLSLALFHICPYLALALCSFARRLKGKFFDFKLPLILVRDSLWVCSNVTYISFMLSVETWKECCLSYYQVLSCCTPPLCRKTFSFSFMCCLCQIRDFVWHLQSSYPKGVWLLLGYFGSVSKNTPAFAMI